jgi:hypothetical protein
MDGRACFRAQIGKQWIILVILLLQLIIDKRHRSVNKQICIPAKCNRDRVYTAGTRIGLPFVAQIGLPFVAQIGDLGYSLR